MNWYSHPYTESKLFTFARPLCVTCESLFVFSAKSHTRGIKGIVSVRISHV